VEAKSGIHVIIIDLDIIIRRRCGYSGRDIGQIQGTIQFFLIVLPVVEGVH
jgi:hypothetical protein